MISAIILAAGEAKRMRTGSGKQLLPLGLSTILGTTIDNVSASAVAETIVVLGFKAKEMRAEIAAKPVKIVVNPSYSHGMSASIVAGIAVAGESTDGFLLVLGDQPFIGTRIIDRLLRAFNDHSQKIIIPTFRGQRGHPVVIPVKYKAELLDLKGDVGARELIGRHGPDVLAVEVYSEGILIDIDTQEEYRAFRDRQE